MRKFEPAANKIDRPYGSAVERRTRNAKVHSSILCGGRFIFYCLYLRHTFPNQIRDARNDFSFFYQKENTIKNCVHKRSVRFHPTSPLLEIHVYASRHAVNDDCGTRIYFLLYRSVKQLICRVY
jgi:hypothetical protein